MSLVITSKSAQEHGAVRNMIRLRQLGGLTMRNAHLLDYLLRTGCIAKVELDRGVCWIVA